MTVNSLFIKISKSASKQKLFFFPHAGGSASQFVSIFNSLNIPCELYILNLPGRSLESKPNFYTEFATLMNDIYREMKFEEGEKVYLLGHSMGSLLVYDLVKYLETSQPGRLIAFGISAIRAPNLRFRKSKMTHLSDPDFLNAIEVFQPLPEVIKRNKVALELTVRTLKSDFKIIESFPPSGTYFANKAAGYLFGGTDDKSVTEDELAEWFEKLNIDGGPILFPGDHFYIFKNMDAIIKTFNIES